MTRAPSILIPALLGALMVLASGCGRAELERARVAEMAAIAAAEETAMREQQQQEQLQAAAQAAEAAAAAAAAQEKADAPGDQGKGVSQPKADKSTPEKPDQPAPDPQDAIKKFLAALAKEKIELDLKQKTVTIPVIVNRPQNDLEYLLIYPSGKKHESLLITPSLPSMIKAALMAIGLENGKNASFKKKEPMPTQAELEAGADPYVLVPPSGPSVHMTVAYQDKAGKKVELAIEDLLLDWTANLTVTGNTWVYLGGRMAQMYRNEPPVFMADYEGNLISVCYRYPNNHLVTLEHERARDEMNWTINRDKCPPAGTEMKLTFQVEKPEVVRLREARMRKEAEARKLKGKDIDLTKRPERNPAREGGGFPPPDPPKKEPPKTDPPKQDPPKKK